MAQNSNSLELNWINKEKSLYYEYDKEGNPKKPVWVDKNDIRVSEKRVLKLIKSYESDSKKNISKNKSSENNKDLLDNAIIKGDNLLALQTLSELFKNRSEIDKIKCVYLDPPYNTGSAFDHYDDNLEHSKWLTMIRDRLNIIKSLLRKDGLVFVQIDDKEVHYLKILMDEIFGRQNYLNSICVKMSTPSGLKVTHAKKTILKVKEHVLVYALDKSQTTINPQYIPKDKWDTEFQYFLDKKNSKDIKKWKVRKLNDVLEENNLEIDMTNKKFKDFYKKNADCIWQRQFNMPEDIKELSRKKKNKIIEYQNKKGTTIYAYNGRRMHFLKDSMHECLDASGKYTIDISYLACDFWDDISTTRLFNEGTVDFNNGKKPEKLIKRIIEMSTKKGDLVLDSFAGSGTTAAVAHKLKRRWITIEIGKHAKTHCVKRLQAIINGEDQDKIKYGGSFNYLELGKTVIDLKKEDLNWKLEIEEIARNIFLNNNYTFSKELDNNIYLGIDNNNLALCLIDKKTKIFNKKDISKIIKMLNEEHKKIKNITLYTNQGLAIKKGDLESNIIIKKLPQEILNQFNIN